MNSGPPVTLGVAVVTGPVVEVLKRKVADTPVEVNDTRTP